MDDRGESSRRVSARVLPLSRAGRRLGAHRGRRASYSRRENPVSRLPGLRRVIGARSEGASIKRLELEPLRSQFSISFQSPAIVHFGGAGISIGTDAWSMT